MNIEEVREYCLLLKNVTESLPFGEDHLVFKVENKMFAVTPLMGGEPSVALKCDPEQAEILRDKYRAVEPAFHFNKKYWNSIFLERDMPTEVIKQWITHSYNEVLAKLPKRVRILYNEA